MWFHLCNEGNFSCKCWSQLSYSCKLKSQIGNFLLVSTILYRMSFKSYITTKCHWMLHYNPLKHALRPLMWQKIHQSFIGCPLKILRTHKMPLDAPLQSFRTCIMTLNVTKCPSILYRMSLKSYIPTKCHWMFHYSLLKHALRPSMWQKVHQSFIGCSKSPTYPQNATGCSIAVLSRTCIETLSVIKSPILYRVHLSPTYSQNAIDYFVVVLHIHWIP
jgi:hypothetical protein